MQMEALISAFLTYTKVEKGLAANTVAAYKRDLGKFAAFAEKRGLALEELTRDRVVDFLSELYRQELDSRSVARHLVSVRNLFRFALSEEVLTSDPTLNLESPKVRKSLPTYLRMEEVDRLLSQPDPSTRNGLRDRAIIELLYSTGLRVSELADLQGFRRGEAHGLLALRGKG